MPLPVAPNCSTPDSGARGKDAGRQRLDRNPGAVRIERVVAVPAHPRRTGDLAGALVNLEPVEPHARPFETQRGGGGLERLSVCDPVVDGETAEAEWRLVLAVEVILAGDEPIDRVGVEQERVAQIGERPASDPDERVDFFTAVLARVAQREQALGRDA